MMDHPSQCQAFHHTDSSCERHKREQYKISAVDCWLTRFDISPTNQMHVSIFRFMHMYTHRHIRIHKWMRLRLWFSQTTYSQSLILRELLLLPPAAPEDYLHVGLHRLQRLSVTSGGAKATSTLVDAGRKNGTIIQKHPQCLRRGLLHLQEVARSGRGWFFGLQCLQK